MNSVAIIVLSALLLFNLTGLLAALMENKNLHRRSRYLEGALGRAKSLAAQKDLTVKRQQEEINRLSEHNAVLEKRCESLRRGKTGQQRRYVVLEQNFLNLQQRHRILEKTLSEKAARLATIEQQLREKGETSS